MRILHVISGIAREQGGPTFALEGLARAQKAVGLDVSVLATWQMVQGRDNAGTFHAMGVPCDVYGPAHGKFSKLKGLNAIVARHIATADVVHIHAMWEEVQHVAAVEARRAGVPYVWRTCNAISWPIMQKSYWLKRGVLAWRLKRDLNGAALLHYTTENERRETAWLGLHAPSTVEPNGVDLSSPPGDAARFVKQFPQLAGRKIVLFVGRLNAEKGLDLLVPAFAKARQEDWSLVLVGSDPERPYRHVVEAMIHEQGLTDHAVLTGHLEGQAKADAYAAADLFVLASKSENFGNVVLEAMAARIPPIVTRGVGLAGEVEASGAGIVVDHSVAALERAIGTLMRDSSQRQRLSGLAEPFVRGRFEWLEIARRWQAHYSELAKALPGEAASG